MARESRFVAVTCGAVVALGMMPLFEKLAVESNAGLTGVVLSINLLTVVLLLQSGWQQRPQQITSSWRSLLLVGSLASGLVVFLNLWALETTSATHRSVFQAMYPAMTAVFAFLLLGERLPAAGYLVIGAMSCGVILMSTGGFRWQLVEGDLLLLLTLPLMGLCDAWARSALETLAPQWVALARFSLGSVVLLLCLSPWLGSIHWPQGITWLWVGLSSACIGFGINMLYRAMQLKGAAIAAAMMSLAPVVTLTAEWYWLDAAFQSVELLGMVIVLAGGYLLTRPAFQAGPEQTDSEQTDSEQTVGKQTVAEQTTDASAGSLLHRDEPG